MDLIDRQEVDKIIDDLLENDNLQASPSVWHGLHMIKQLPSARSCETCLYRHLMWFEEPCDSCTVGGESNHWKPKEPERKKGKWIADSGMIYCPECRYGYDGIFKRYYNFCPNCGADMRGEQP